MSQLNTTFYKKRTRNHRPLCLEHLQCREMMAANVFISGDQLSIYADRHGSSVTVEHDYLGQLVVRDDGRKLDPCRHSTHCEPSDAERIFFLGGDGSDYFRNSTGLPSLVYTGDGINRIYGGSGADVFYGGTSVDRLVGGGGNDTIYGFGGKDWLYGGDDNDTIVGGDGVDHIFGEDGNDMLSGGRGADVIEGGKNRDFLSGGEGNDRLDGQTGDDEIHGNVGNDTLVGGYGNDQLFGDRGHDYLYGGPHDDHMDGGPDNDWLYGWNGDDVLYGGAGHDQLHGGGDNDGLFGGYGSDVLYGGGGADRFLTQPLKWQNYNRDYVKDAQREDAQILFVDGMGERYPAAEYYDANSNKRLGPVTWWEAEWTQQGIQTVDSALKVLHDATGNTGLLKKSGGGRLVFKIVSQPNQQLVTELNGWNDGSKIVITELALQDRADLVNQIEHFDDPQDAARSTVFHEVGHHWDELTEHALVGNFRSLSGWISSDPLNSRYVRTSSESGGTWWYLATADFVSEYARTDPYEDFAATFAKRMMQRMDGRFIVNDPNSSIDEKLKIIDELIKQLA